MKTRLISILSSSAALLAMACGASAPSKELMTARNAYSQARNSEAAQLNPAGVHDAYKSLQAAEIAHADDAGSTREKHYAYLATRKSETAISAASGALAKQELERADQSYQAMLKQQSERATSQRDSTQQALEQNNEALQQSQRELEETRQNAQRAQELLREEQALREEAGRTIIGLTGVLFTSGGHELSPPARRRLDTVASALGMYADRDITIEGYTDSSGNEEANQTLSQKRAEAVREYLIERGISPDRLHATGHGEESPIAPNDTAEGRASNRRVEVVVQPPTTDSTMGSGTKGSQQKTTPQGAPVPGPTLPAGPRSDDDVDDEMP